jgi:hypothetical protein
MPTRDVCHCFLIHVLPARESRRFEESVCAYAVCWIPVALKESEAEARGHAVSMLNGEGWEIARVHDHQLVSDTSYAANDAGREEYEQAIADGFVASMNTVEREVFCIDDAELPGARTAASYASFVDKLTGGAWSLFSAGDDVASCSFPDDAAYVPLWASSGEALACAGEWPEHHVKAVSPPELHALLARLHRDETGMVIGLEGTLVRTSPLMLLRDLTGN